MFEWKSALAVVLELLVVCGLATLPSQSDFFKTLVVLLLFIHGGGMAF